MAFAWKAAGITYVSPPIWTTRPPVGKGTRKGATLLIQGYLDRYNRYLAIAARVVRRSLKEDLRIQAERRGEMDLRFARWEVRSTGKPERVVKRNRREKAERHSH